MVILKWLIQFKLVIGATAVKINKQTGNHGDCIFRFCVTPVELPSFFSCRIIDFQFDKIKRTLLYLMSSCLLCCWKWVFAMTSAFSRQNSVSLCPTLFCSSRPNFPVTPDISWLPTFAIESLMMNRTYFVDVRSWKSLELLGLHRTDQLQLLWPWW